MATIKVRQNGSLLVEGDDVKLIDWNGNEYTPGQAAVRAVPVRSLDEQAVLRRHAFQDRLPGGEAAIGPEAVDRPADQVKPPDTV